jgi:hypothetical protein
MIYLNENNWYTWHYGTDKKTLRQTNSSLPFYTHYKKTKNKILDFKTELDNAASSILDHYPNIKPCIFFSGGVDSELLLRSYLNVGANPNVYIFRYENDYNLYDVSYAVTICNLLNVKYHIIDFNLQKFYENDAEKISEESQIDIPKALPHLKFMDYVDGLPIYGEGDLFWFRNNDDYSKSGKWLTNCWEHEIGWSKYILYKNRPAIMEWFKWTPGLVVSYTNLKWFQNLINDKYYGKLGVRSTKMIGFKEIYPDLINRKKQTGFENVEFLCDALENYFIKKYNGLPFRNSCTRSYAQLIKEIVG